MTNQDKILITDLKKIILGKFGETISGIFCFGSRVSKNRVDSDFDILVITSLKTDWEQEYQISKSIVHFGIAHDIVFDIQFMSKNEFEVDFNFHPFVQSVKATGLYL